MLQKFAMAVKTKTIEFFGEEEEDDDDAVSVASGILSADEVITDQRVVVLKPDRPESSPLLVPLIFASLASFRAAYLHVQSAHSPLRQDDLRAADRSAVSLLRRLSHLKHSPPSLPLSPLLQSHVQDNQTLLRACEAAVNRLQAEIDRRDSEADELKREIRSIDAENSRMERALEHACSPAQEKVDAFLTLGMFNSVLKEACRAVHRFSRVLLDVMRTRSSNLDLNSAADLIYPDIVYTKPGHCRYAFLSYVCLKMFSGFNSDGFCCTDGENAVENKNAGEWRWDSLRQFIEHSRADAMDLVSSGSSCPFSRFCERKFQQLIQTGNETLLFGCLDKGEEPASSSLQASSVFYEAFVNMASSIWMVHKLGRAYDPVVEIFQVGEGAEFSIVYMETVVQAQPDWRKVERPKVGFTVVPGFHVGKTIIQCRVYIHGEK